MQARTSSVWMKRFKKKVLRNWMLYLFVLPSFMARCMASRLLSAIISLRAASGILRGPD